MDIQNHKQNRLFELKPTSSTSKVAGGVFPPGRILMGRTESCDLIVNAEAVSAVHAVLEIFNDRAIIYDMNSTNGTYVNDDKVIVKEMRPGDTFRLADVEFTFIPYTFKESLPPVLETLEPEHGAASVKHSPGIPEVPKQLPKVAPVVSDVLPSIVYPLASDPRAEYSEYIFEDKDDLYPIFKYGTVKQAVEVIILFKDKVFSVDYLPEGKSVYSITGLQSSAHEIEFPYLRKEEKLPFVEIKGTQITVHTLPGFSIFYLSDSKKDSGHQSANIDLSGKDLIRLHKGDLQIFVRNVQAPPEVLAAPILKRDPEFRKYLLLFLVFVIMVSVGINLVPIPEDVKEEELAPERLATILYKQPLIQPKKNTPPAPVVSPKPKKVAVKPKAPDIKVPDVPKPDVVSTKDQTKKPDPGSVSAAEKKVVKQGTEPIKKPSKQAAAPAPALGTSTKGQTAKKPVAYSPVNAKTQGHVEVYRSSDFASTVNTMVAKGGSLSGAQTSLSGSQGSGSSADLGISTGVATGTGAVKTAGIQTNQGSLVGATTGTLEKSKGAEGLSSKKTIYTAGVPTETVVLGSMDPDIIRRILLDHISQFRYCYQREIDKTGAEAGGVIKLNFTIGASGHVAGAGVEGAAGVPTEVKKCVISVLKAITFPEPLGGGKVEVKQPMNFYPKKL